ncbi:hypothetical protein SGGMMB4_01169 [Sodalis glossinidius str. 'morsitans']|nr:hypothetical protein SGGMMB4_01169 [Sodalis glossinidius str. 'morsitans']
MFDGAGLVASLQAEGFMLRGQHVKQLGSSGAAVALLGAGVASLTLCDPNGEVAQALVDRINAYYPNEPTRVSTAPADLHGIDSAYQLLPRRDETRRGPPCALYRVQSGATGGGYHYASSRDAAYRTRVKRAAGRLTAGR